MATVIYPLDVRGADVGTANIPELFLIAGTNFPSTGYAFDDTAIETIYFKVPYIPTYGSGNITLVIDWYSRTGQTTGAAAWSAAIAAITPGDAVSYETKAFGTSVSSAQTVSGTARAINRFTSLAISSLDSVASGDDCIFLLSRNASAGGDTMTGDACVVNAYLSYSDT